MKKIVSTILCLMLIFTLAVPAFAEAGNISRQVPSTPVIVERVDIPRAEAIGDPSFSIQRAKEISAFELNPYRGGYWDVYGYVEHDASWTQCRAVGFSGQYTDNDFLMDTYHYTRTFFGSSLAPFGDSGREWASGLVQATGTWVSWGYASNKVQKVYYGTEE